MKKNAKVIAGMGAGIVAGGLVLAGLGTANASTTTTPIATPLAQSASNDTGNTGETADASFTGSIKVPESKAGSEQAEQQEMAALAKIDEATAKADATASTGGTATSVELGDENGYLVYDVTVTQADGSSVSVLVDAGNGSVLSTEPETADDQGKEASDGDGETADDQGANNNASDQGKDASNAKGDNGKGDNGNGASDGDGETADDTGATAGN